MIDNNSPIQQDTIGSLPWRAYFSQLHDFLKKPIQNSLVFSGSWGNAGAPYQTVVYYMDSGFNVHLDGVAKRSAGAVAGETIGTLPVGFRPSNTLIFPVLGNGAIAQVNIDNNGIISYQSGSSTITFSLSGISFQV